MPRAGAAVRDGGQYGPHLRYVTPRSSRRKPKPKLKSTVPIYVSRYLHKSSQPSRRRGRNPTAPPTAAGPARRARVRWRTAAASPGGPAAAPPPAAAAAAGTGTARRVGAAAVEVCAQAGRLLCCYVRGLASQVLPGVKDLESGIALRVVYSRQAIQAHTLM